MTRPPDDRWDPNRQHPETRRFDPADETAAYRPAEPPAPDELPVEESAAGQHEPYDPPQAYTQPGYGQPQYGQPGYGAPGYGAPGYAEPGYGEPGYGEPPPPPKKHTGRTVGLALAALAALVVVVLVGVLIARGSGSDGNNGTAGASSAPSTTTTTTTSRPTTTTTTEEATTTTPPPTVAPGAVVYQITGNGDIVGIRYRSGAEFTFVAAAGSPWSQAATVTGGSAEMTAIVLRGPVTCNILHGQDLLASSTSNGGPLRCAATVP